VASQDFSIGVREVSVIVFKVDSVLDGALEIIPDSKCSDSPSVVAKVLPDNVDTRTNEGHGKAGTEDGTIGGRGNGRGYHCGKNRGRKWEEWRGLHLGEGNVHRGSCGELKGRRRLRSDAEDWQAGRCCWEDIFI